MANEAIKGFGELAIRVKDFETMKAFYRDVVGLDVYSEDVPGLVFFRIAEAVEGHPQLLAIFDRPVDPALEPRKLDHFAFVIDLADYETEKERLEGLGVPVILRTFPHFHWRSIFYADPEGNTVELVSADPDVR